MACIYWVEDQESVREQIDDVTNSSKADIRLCPDIDTLRSKLDRDLSDNRRPGAIVWDIALGRHNDDDMGEVDAEPYIAEYRERLGIETFFAAFSSYPSSRINRMTEKEVAGVPMLDLGLTKMFYSTEAAAYRVINEVNRREGLPIQTRPNPLNGLWLEDSITQAEMISDALEDLGHNITMVHNLDELSNALGPMLTNAGNYDFIAYDLEVAGERADGTVVRNRKHTPESTVVVVYSSSSDRANFLKKNGHCDVAMSKGMYRNPHDVGARIEQYISLRNQKKIVQNLAT